jgi:hypothetical protein
MMLTVVPSAVTFSSSGRILGMSFLIAISALPFQFGRIEF